MDGGGNTGPIGGLRTEVSDLPESGIVELVNYGREVTARDGRDLIGLWVGEGDQPTPAFIMDALERSLRAGNTFYTYQRGTPRLRQALADYHSRTYGLTFPMERFYITHSGMQAIMLSMQSLIGPGDEVVLPTPIWPNVLSAVQILGGRTVPVPADLGNTGWTVDLDRLMEACGPKTKAIVLNSPCNPTGWMMPREQMIALRDFARMRGLWIVADEVYGRMVFDRHHAPSFLEICEPEDRLLVVNTFSKNWAMTGFRVGWVVAPPSLGQVFENLVQFNTSGVAVFLQDACATAVEDGDAFLARTIDRCRQGRDLVEARLSALPRVRFGRSAGGFYTFFAVDGEADSRALAFRLVDEAGVGLAPGSAFGPGGEEYLRLCFATSTARLSEAMDRLEPVLS